MKKDRPSRLRCKLDFRIYWKIQFFRPKDLRLRKHGYLDRGVFVILRWQPSYPSEHGLVLRLFPYEHLLVLSQSQPDSLMI